MGSLDSDFVDQFVKQWLELWSTKDLELLKALCADDVRMSDPAMPEPVIGLTDGEKAVKDFLAVFPDFRVDRVSFYPSPDEPELMAQWNVSGTMRGALDPPGFAPTNSPVQFEGATLIRFRDELISEIRWYYDVMDVGRQIGAAPLPGSFAERSSVFMQRMKALKLRKSAPA